LFSKQPDAYTEEKMRSLISQDFASGCSEAQAYENAKKNNVKLCEAIFGAFELREMVRQFYAGTLRAGGDGARAAVSPSDEPSVREAPPDGNAEPVISSLAGRNIKSLRVSESEESHESQESHESHDSQEPPSGGTASKPPKENPSKKTSPGVEVVLAAGELARQLMAEFDKSPCTDEFLGWNWPFRLARRLKAFGPLGQQFLEHAAQAFLDVLVEEIFDYGLTTDADELVFNVQAAWDEVRVPEGSDILRVAAERARQSPVRLLMPHLEPCQRLASVAYHLSVLMVDEPILLPQHRVAELLDVRQTTISRMTRWLVEGGILKPADTNWSKQQKKAKTYTFAAQEGRDFTAV
jgi:hypothetical protein